MSFSRLAACPYRESTLTSRKCIIVSVTRTQTQELAWAKHCVTNKQQLDKNKYISSARSWTVCPQQAWTKSIFGALWVYSSMGRWFFLWLACYLDTSGILNFLQWIVEETQIWITCLYHYWPFSLWKTFLCLDGKNKPPQTHCDVKWVTWSWPLSLQIMLYRKRTIGFRR